MSKYDRHQERLHQAKIQRPPVTETKHRLNDQTQLCYCGDPKCPGSNGAGVQSSSPDSTDSTSSAGGSVSDPRPSLEWTDMIFSGVDLSQAMSRMSRQEMLGEFYGMSPGRISSRRPNSTPPVYSPSNPPPSYRKALEKISDYVVTASATDLDEVVGNDAALAHLRDAIQAPVLHKDLYEAYGMRYPKGAMLYGPPGCGKTMFARAAATEFRRLYGEHTVFVSVSGSELQSMYVGETEKKIVELFDFAREYKNLHGHPLLIFMDEAEVLLPDRSGTHRYVAAYEEAQVATFLAQMDGVRESGAFVMLATNRPEVIDQAVLRDGRCDLKIRIERPDPASLEVILTRVLSPVLRAPTTTLQDLVFAAAESFRDPHKILVESHVLAVQLGILPPDATHPSSRPGLTYAKHHRRHFLLEHVVSGAMATSVAQRSIRHAFARDKLAPPGTTPTGVTVSDVVSAVSDVFEESRAVDHTYALNEFREQFEREMREEHESERHSPPASTQH